MFRILRAFRLCLGIELEVEVEEVKEKITEKKELEKIQDDSTFLSGADADKKSKKAELKKEKRKKKLKEKTKEKEKGSLDKSPPIVEEKEVIIEISEVEPVKEKKPLKSILKKVSRFKK